MSETKWCSGERVVPGGRTLAAGTWYGSLRGQEGPPGLTGLAGRILSAVLGLVGSDYGSLVMVYQGRHGTWTKEVVATLGDSGGETVLPTDEMVARLQDAGGAICCGRPSAWALPGDAMPGVVIPLTAEGLVVGVLSVGPRGQSGGYGQEELAMLARLGAGLGPILLDARAYSLQGRVAMLERLLSLGQALASQVDERNTLETALAGVRDILGVRWCVLRLLEPGSGELVIRAGEGMSPELERRAWRVSGEGNLLGEAMRRGVAIAVDDVATVPVELRLPYYAQEIQAMAVAPLMAGGRPLGTLKVYSPVPRCWSEEELGYLTTVATQVALAVENAHAYAALRRQHINAMQALATALEVKDEYTRGHSVRVARLAQACAEVLGLDEDHREHLYVAALLHDVGKIGVPERVLHKTSTLDAHEWEEVKCHPIMGAKIVEPVGFLPVVVAAIRSHHEHWNGRGYPDGLAGEAIPLMARIISVADAYDAITSERPFRMSGTGAAAVAELVRGAGSQFDPGVVKALLQLPGIRLDEPSA